MTLSPNHQGEPGILNAELELEVPILAGSGPVLRAGIEETACQSRWEAYFHFGDEDTQEALRVLMQQYLVPPLQVSDLYDILRGMANFLDPRSQSRQRFQDQTLPESSSVPLPIAELSQELQNHLAAYLDADEIAAVVRYTLSRIHQQLQNPRNSWPEPLWVFEAGGQKYITQATTAESAKARVSAQYPQLAEQDLVLVEVSGILAPNPVIRVAAPSPV